MGRQSTLSPGGSDLAIALTYVVAGIQCALRILAHSTRAISTPLPGRLDLVSPSSRAATWSKRNTFICRYRIDLLSCQDQAFRCKVLQAVVPP